MNDHPDAALPARRSRLAGSTRALPAAFYDRATARVARDLLGAILETRVDGVRTSGRVVEVEAYLGPHDPACHAAAGLTRRNRHLHGPPGRAYVYRIYGLHWCVNAVTREDGHGSAVLIRALVPLEGIADMRARRGDVDAADLANGPGKLCQALGITGAHDGVSLARGIVRMLRGTPVSDDQVIVTPRIGITQAADWPLRFLVDGDSHLSRTPRSFARLTLADVAEWERKKRLR